MEEHATANAEARPLMPVTPRGEATRQRILDAAETVFGEMGYYEASVSEITRRASVAQGTFYIYFHSKREIFVELVGYVGQRLRAVTRTAIAEAPNRLEGERRAFVEFFAFVANHRMIYRILQDAERVAPEAADAYYHGISRGYERGLRAAMDAGEIRETHAEAITYALMGIGHFISLRWLIWPVTNGGTDRWEGLPEDVLSAVLDFLTAGLARQADD
jgi:AcrR family transcriptional regulator